VTSAQPSLSRLALQATTHCLTGCAIGEVVGMVIATAVGWGAFTAIVLSVILSFFFGYALTMRPLLASGLPVGRATRLALSADTVSITVMEITDNAILLVIPAALNAQLNEPLFWGSLALSLAVAGLVAFPVNRWLIGRGQGHAVVHGAHQPHRG
jgi:hypothetical protein